MGAVMLDGAWRPLGDARALLEVLGRTYKRDKDGQFSSGSGGGYQAGSDVSSTANFDEILQAQQAGGTTRNEDAGMGAIQRLQGFDGPPQVVSRQDFDAAVAGGEVTETFRGLAGGNAQQYAEAYRTGTLYPANGLFGSGTYVATSRAGAQGYAELGGGQGAVMRIGVTDQVADLDRKMRSEAEHTADDDVAGRVAIYQRYGTMKDRVGAEYEVMSDPGRFAAARGYDAIITDAPANVSIATTDRQIVILNRTATIVEAE